MQPPDDIIPIDAETAETADEPQEESVHIKAITALKAESEKLRDQWIRAVAETENVRKRAQRDVEETSKYAVSGFARDMVNVVENLTRALESIPEEESEGGSMLATLRRGVEMTLQEMLGALSRHGVERINPIGQKFDHHLHQAVAQIEAPDAEPGTVVQVLQAGYTLHGRLLKAAMVGVAKQAASSPKAVDTLA